MPVASLALPSESVDLRVGAAFSTPFGPGHWDCNPGGIPSEVGKGTPTFPHSTSWKIDDLRTVGTTASAATLQVVHESSPMLFMPPLGASAQKGSTLAGIVGIVVIGLLLYGAWRLLRRMTRGSHKTTSSLSDWQAERDEAEELLQTARTFHGDRRAEGLLLANGETVFAVVLNTALIEDRKGAGHWEGRSSGVSVPLGHGVRYRVGKTRGHYVSGPARPSGIDEGTSYITSKRVIFKGARQTRECVYSKMIGYEHDDAGLTTFAVSNRQKATRIAYGADVAPVFRFRLDLALAHFNGTVPEMVSDLEAYVSDVNGRRPRILPA